MWAHAVNSRQKLKAALDNPNITLLEVDVRMNMAGPYLMHDPGIPDLTLQYFLQSVQATVKENPRRPIGIKLDFKEPYALLPSLEMTSQWTGAIFYNADILQGPAGLIPLFNPHDFIKSCLTWGAPQATLSLGWTVGVPLSMDGIGYTGEHVSSMLQLCANYNLSRVTFPMHTVHALASPKAQEQLLLAHPAYTITYWGVADDVMLADLRKRDPKRVFIDVNKPVDALEASRLKYLRELGKIQLKEPAILFLKEL